jgi:hypothetical protein
MQTGDIPRSGLFIGIVEGQMSWDHSYRFYDHYGDKRFKRFLHEGFSCENVLINDLPSYTA